MRMTPNTIEILLHYYVSPDPHPRIGAPAVNDDIQMLVSVGLISLLHGKVYQTTDRGEAHIKQLCNLPFPKRAWIGSNNEVIDIGK